MGMQPEVVTEEGVCLYSGIRGVEQVQQAFSEAKKSGKTPSGCLRVKLPVGYVDACTANGNHYESKEIERVIKETKASMKAGLISGAHGEHPKERAELRPDEISHIVTDMWIDKKNKVTSKEGNQVPSLWNEWLIIPTEKAGGKDLIELFKAGASVGCSIRGTAVREQEKYMRHYRFCGTDTVSTPSTGVYSGTQNENMKATIAYESLEDVSEENLSQEKLKSLIMEKDTKMGNESTLREELSSISESLKGGDGNSSNILDLGFRIGALEAKIETLDKAGIEKESKLKEASRKLSEVKTIKANLEAEKDEAVKQCETYKKTVKELESQMDRIEKDLNTEKSQKSTAVDIIKDLRDRHNALLESTGSTDVEDSSENFDFRAVEDLRNHALKAEELLRTSTNYIHTLESALEQVRDYAIALEKLVSHGAETHTTERDKSVEIIEDLRDLANGAKVQESSAAIGNWVTHLLAKYPKLKHFSEELRECKTTKQIEHRVQKYLDIVDQSGLRSFISEDTRDVEERKVQAKGIEKLIPGWR